MTSRIGRAPEEDWIQDLRRRVWKAARERVASALDELRSGKKSVRFAPWCGALTRKKGKVKGPNYGVPFIIDESRGRSIRDEPGTWFDQYMNEWATELTEKVMESFTTLSQACEAFQLPPAGALLRECLAAEIMTE